MFVKNRTIVSDLLKIHYVSAFGTIIWMTRDFSVIEYKKQSRLPWYSNVPTEKSNDLSRSNYRVCSKRDVFISRIQKSAGVSRSFDLSPGNSLFSLSARAWKIVPRIIRRSNKTQFLRELLALSQIESFQIFPLNWQRDNFKHRRQISIPTLQFIRRNTFRRGYRSAVDNQHAVPNCCTDDDAQCMQEKAKKIRFDCSWKSMWNEMQLFRFARTRGNTRCRLVIVESALGVWKLGIITKNL